MPPITYIKWWICKNIIKLSSDLNGGYWGNIQYQRRKTSSLLNQDEFEFDELDLSALSNLPLPIDLNFPNIFLLRIQGWDKVNL
jgi:hypothetical protein